jgi:polyphosphate glucokinase
LKRHGQKKWRRHVADVVTRLIAALEPDETVIGGGNVGKLAILPPHARVGDNANAFIGGFRLWPDETKPSSSRESTRLSDQKGRRRWPHN